MAAMTTTARERLQAERQIFAAKARLNAVRARIKVRVAAMKRDELDALIATGKLSAQARRDEREDYRAQAALAGAIAKLAAPGA